ncbi:MAG: hypothetical protein V5A64_06085 [Candidatus Thermoplasmatota archaeon]
MTSLLSFDTAALVSLGHTDLLKLINENFTILLTESIIEELKEIAQRNDHDGYAAKSWLKYSSSFSVEKAKKKKSAEDELFEICKNKDIPLVTDDIKAVKKFEDTVTCFFSVHIVYLLFKKQLISQEKAVLSIEKMKTERDWKQNLIAVTGKFLFD